jgi:hypothetical protein
MVGPIIMLVGFVTIALCMILDTRVIWGHPKYLFVQNSALEALKAQREVVTETKLAATLKFPLIRSARILTFFYKYIFWEPMVILIVPKMSTKLIFTRDTMERLTFKVKAMNN